MEKILNEGIKNFNPNTEGIKITRNSRGHNWEISINPIAERLAKSDILRLKELEDEIKNQFVSVKDGGLELEDD
jgi:hypothetical protein